MTKEKLNGVVVEENFLKSEIAKFNLADTTIAKMKEEYMPLTVKDPGDTEGFNKVHEARMVMVKARTEVEKKRKEIKEVYLKTGKAIDTEAKRLTALMNPIETHLQQQEEIVTREIERQAAERERIELEKYNDRKSILIDMEMNYNPITFIYSLEELEVHDCTLRIMKQEDFDSFAKSVQAKFEALSLKKAEADRLAKEELEKQAKLEEEQEAERLRLEKIAQEQAEAQAEIKRQQEAIEKEKRDLEHAKQIEEAKKEAVKQAEINRAAEEEKKKQAELEEQYQAQLAEQRAYELKPDKAKLFELAEQIKGINMPELKSPSAIAIANSVTRQLEKIVVYINDQTADLK